MLLHTLFPNCLVKLPTWPHFPQTLDILSKQFEQLHILLIDETSCIGSQMLFNIDKILREIFHMPTKPFGNVDVIFCGDFYQAEPIRDSWIFDQPKLHG